MRIAIREEELGDLLAGQVAARVEVIGLGQIIHTLLVLGQSGYAGAIAHDLGVVGGRAFGPPLAGRLAQTVQPVMQGLVHQQAQQFFILAHLSGHRAEDEGRATARAAARETLGRAHKDFERRGLVTKETGDLGIGRLDLGQRALQVEHGRGQPIADERAFAAFRLADDRTGHEEAAGQIATIIASGQAALSQTADAAVAFAHGAKVPVQIDLPWPAFGRQGQKDRAGGMKALPLGAHIHQRARASGRRNLARGGHIADHHIADAGAAGLPAAALAEVGRIDRIDIGLQCQRTCRVVRGDSFSTLHR